MNFILCKSNLEKGNVSHSINFDGHRIIINGVPANICKQCVEYYIENNVALDLEKIVKDEKMNNAEITIINYSEI